MANIKLTELEFNKLVRLSEQFQRLQLEAKIQAERSAEVVKDAHANLLSYMKEIKAMYAEFDPNAAYNVNESTFELIPTAPATPVPQPAVQA